MCVFRPPIPYDHQRLSLIFIHQNWVIRMPNFVKMDTKPFHPDTYLGPEEEDSMQAENLREKSMSIKLKVENTVRWRWVKDSNGIEVGPAPQAPCYV